MGREIEQFRPFRRACDGLLVVMIAMSVAVAGYGLTVLERSAVWGGAMLGIGGVSAIALAALFLLKADIRLCQGEQARNQGKNVGNVVVNLRAN